MSYEIRPASAEDNAGILDLITRTPQQGLLHLNFERDPDFFAGARVTCERPDAWVATHSDAPEMIVAVINIGSRRVWLNGEVRVLRYGHDLRIDPAHRGGLLLHRIFRRLKTVLAPGEWMQTVILDGNDVSLSTVGSGRAGMPTYHPCGHFSTYLLPTRRRRLVAVRGGPVLRRATREDVPRLQVFLDREGPRRQFFPVLDLAQLLDGGDYFRGLSPEDFLLALDGEDLVGVLGTWDQHAYKRTRVLAYPGALRWARHGYNAVSAVIGGMTLPAAGDCFNYRSLHTVCVRDDDTRVFAALLERALCETDDSDALVAACFPEDPFARELARRSRRTMQSRHFLVCYDRDPRAEIDPSLTRSVEIARL